MIPSAPTPPRVLLECVKAGQTAHREGLCRVDNPHTGKSQYASLLIRDTDRVRMAEAWWKGWDLAEQAARAGGAPFANPEGDRR